MVCAALCACGEVPQPSCGALGAAQACPCPGGQPGAQECGLRGVWSACVCADGGTAEAGVDAGDAPELEVAVDAPAEAGLDAAADATVAADADGGDAAAEVAMCAPGFADCNDAPGCETDITTVLNCGGCGRSCPTSGFRCCPTSETNRCPRADQPCQ